MNLLRTDKILLALVLFSTWSWTLIIMEMTSAEIVDGGIPQVKIEVEDYQGVTTLVNTTLYRKENPDQIQPYLYDGINVLNVVEYIYACYYVTCTAPYPVKWVTNIPLKQFTPEFYCKGGDTWKYFNSRRLQDHPLKTNVKNRTPVVGGWNSNSYSIQLMFGLNENNGGLLKCESIESPKRSTHYYFVMKEKTQGSKSLVDFLPYTNFVQVREEQFRSIELFWEKNLNSSVVSKLVVPCRGNSLNFTQDLFLGEYKYENKQHTRLPRKIWDGLTGQVVSELKTEIQYEPAIGFTLTNPDLKETVAVGTTNFDGSNPRSTVAGLTCDPNEEDRNVLSFELFVYSSEHQTRRITIVENKFDLNLTSTSALNGCFLIRNQDMFLFERENSKLSVESAQGQHAWKFLHCNSPDECDILRQCLDFEGDSCYSDRGQIQVGANSLKRPHNRGMLRCMDYKGKIGFKPIYEYTFIGLDKIRYVVSEDLPLKSIIYIDETQPVLYTNVESTFRCEISHFILVANIRFGLLFSNGTVATIENKRRVTSDLRSGMYDTDNVRTVMNSNYNLGIGWEQITLNLTSDTVGIICFAPFHNSSNWANVTRHFKARDIAKPLIKKSDDDATKIFHSGDKDVSLRCEASGAPDPTFVWILPNNEELNMNNRPPFTNLGIVKNDDGNSFLLFPPMRKDFEGSYTCVAVNPHGNDTHSYFLRFEVSGLGWGGITGIILGIVVLLALVVGFLIILAKYRYAKRQLRDLTEEEVQEFKNGNGKKQSSVDSPVDINILPFKAEFILNPNLVMTENNFVLGEGQFGIVYRGLLNGVGVAVKTTKSIAGVMYVKAFLSEIKIMSYIGQHDHIVRFLGAVINKIQERSVQAVVELSPFGNLQNYLRKLGATKNSFANHVQNDVIVPMSSITVSTDDLYTEKTSTTELISWSKQIASGMNYLASKRVFHGDLAARNVLVFNDNVVKITDFGLSKQLYASASYVKKQKVPLPWRWMALESLRFMEFSIESDVWAFAVTVWEIFTLGQTPYPGLTWTPEFTNILATGMRMSKPQYCPKDVYEQMMRCWNSNAEERPSFSELEDFFQKIETMIHVSSLPQQSNEEVTTVVYTSMDLDEKDTTVMHTPMDPDIEKNANVPLPSDV